jgi:DnaJ-class molecular chaperone
MFNPFDFDKIAEDLKKASEILSQEQVKNDIVNAFFQGMGGKIPKIPKIPQGKDLRYNLPICFNDAMLGCEREIRVRRLEIAATGESNRVTRVLKFTIPKGHGHQSILKLKEQGDACEDGGKPGDLLVVLLVPADDKDQKYNDLNNDIFTNFQVSSENFNRDLSKMLLLNTDIQQVEQGDTFGEDLRLDLTVGFNDAILGCEREIKIPRLGVTEKGKLEQVIKSLKVNIPAGTNSGNKLRLKGQGDACKHGGKPGDLYLYLLVSPQDKEYKRNDVNIESEIETDGLHFRDKDLRFDMAIGFDEAILGCERDLQISRTEMTEEGELECVLKLLKVNIPAGTNHGSTLRLKGQGNACRYGGEPGDLYLYLCVALQDKERKRNGINIESEIRITSSQASEGCEIVVNTTTGWRTIFVSPGTKTGDSLILSGCGVSQSGNPGKNGDYIIKFVCE